MSLLAQEFGKPITATAFKESLPARPGREKTAIAIDDDLRNRLKEFHLFVFKPYQDSGLSVFVLPSIYSRD
ncbi:MAG: hypothetical protein MZV70_74385 [Desulfobacterales bacterium]|nr:hypothetical protein [Desulfobacterales bacterium]